MGTYTSIFRTPAGEQQYLAAYDATLKHWNFPYTSQFVPTRFGNTHVLATGNGTGTPLVLLHGALTSATMWLPNVQVLGQQHRIYALEILGDANRSTISQVPRNPEEVAQWFNEVLDQLGVPKAHLVGLSLGGAYVFILAIYAPARVASCIALAPGLTLSALSLNFFWQVVPPMLGSGGDVRSLLARATAAGLPAGAFTNDFVAQMNLGIRHANWQVKPPPVFKDEELRRIQHPMLIMFGTAEIMYDTTKALARAKNLIPHVATEMVPKAGHFLSMEQPAVVNRRIQAFLEA